MSEANNNFLSLRPSPSTGRDPRAQKIIISFAIVLIFFGFLFSHKNENNIIKQINIAGVTLNVDVASTAAEQEQGLSGRPSLKDDQGMLFVFATPGRYAFWMKDMNFPLDMIWLDQNLKVIYIERNALPSSYPETFGPSENAKYVLEVNSGFSDKNNLKEGDSASFIY